MSEPIDDQDLEVDAKGARRRVAAWGCVALMAAVLFAGMGFIMAVLFYEAGVLVPGSDP